MKHHHRIHDADTHHLTVALLWGLVIPMLVGMALAALAILAMRRARLRWTWAALATPIAYLAWLIDSHLGLMLATAVVGATAATSSVVGPGSPVDTGYRGSPRS
jgi:uncharacterized BrkB/YihY/UPF0761 family membrane protein